MAKKKQQYHNGDRVRLDDGELYEWRDGEWIDMPTVREQLHKKIDRAVRLIQSAAFPDGRPVEVAYSGGKDSDVILELVRMSGINYRAIYKNTTIDPPGTIKHVEEQGVEIVRPKQTFFQLMAYAGFSNRFQRGCCTVLKEYKILDRSVIGVRKTESTSRAKNYEEPTECRVYGKGKNKQTAEAFYPILDWTDNDIVDFIQERGLKVHPLYYREDGTIDPKRRLGCMCCPLAYYRKRIDYFRRVPGMVKPYIRAAQRYRETHPKGKTVLKYRDAYEWFVREIFFDRQNAWEDYKTVTQFLPPPITRSFWSNTSASSYERIFNLNF